YGRARRSERRRRVDAVRSLAFELRVRRSEDHARLRDEPWRSAGSRGHRARSPRSSHRLPTPKALSEERGRVVGERLVEHEIDAVLREASRGGFGLLVVAVLLRARRLADEEPELERAPEREREPPRAGFDTGRSRLE